MNNYKKCNYKSFGIKFGHYTRDDVKDYFTKLLTFVKDEQIKCLKLITNEQTNEELKIGDSIDKNNRGWSKIDSYRMPRLLKIYNDSMIFRNGPRSRGLTKDHWELLSKVLPKYWVQYAIEVRSEDYMDRMKKFFGD